MSNDFMQDYFGYISGEPPEYVKQIYWKDVIEKIDEGRVIDLGTGSVGHYWALGYIMNVEEVLLTDIDEELLDDLRDKLNSLTPEKLESKFSDTLAFLKKQGIVDEEVAPMDLASNIFRKSRVKEMDFTEKNSGKFDYALSIESLGCVDTKKDFYKAIETAYDCLNDGGILLGVADYYEEGHDYVKKLKKMGLEADLNPDTEDFEEAFEKAGFSNFEIEEHTGDFCPGYSKLMSFKAVKPK